MSFAFSKIDNKKCWLEDESRKIGINVLPTPLYDQMRNAKVAFIDLSPEARINYLVSEYGKFTKEELISATERITKRLGGQNVKRAVDAIKEDNLDVVICLVF